MEFKQLIADDDAVSPVIGVILMVAITVILAAVIGTFVLGLGDQVSNTAPTASFSFNYKATAGDEDGKLADNSDGSTDGVLSITHDGGDTVQRSQLTVGDEEGNSITDLKQEFPNTEVTAGDTAKIEVDNDDTIRVTWKASGGGKTSTLGKWTGPEA